MSRGPKGIEASQRTFPVPRKRARIRTFRQTLIRCRCFSTRQKAEPSLKIPRRRYCIPIKAASQWLTSEGKSTVPVSKNHGKKKRVTPMIRKVNAGTGAQLLIIKRALAFDTCLLVGQRRPRAAVIRGDQTDLDLNWACDCADALPYQMLIGLNVLNFYAGISAWK